MSNDESDGEERDLDLRLVALEIEEEVRQKRASGELTPEFERELDLAFARLAPPGALEGDFDQLMERAEHQAFFDLLAPNESARPGVPHVKRVVQKTIRWYMRYVVDQVTGFSHTITKAVRQLGERVDRVEKLAPRDAELYSALAKWHFQVDDDSKQQIVDAMNGVEGRVLHVCCSTGRVVEQLVATGVDAYGIDPVSELIAFATRGDSPLDLRHDDPAAHLKAVAPQSLGGIVLTGCVDVLPRGSQFELLDLAHGALRPGGRLAVLVTDPRVWDRNKTAIESDLAPGRPMHAETWGYLLDHRGFSDVTVTPGERGDMLQYVSEKHETKSAIIENANIDKLNGILFPSSQWLLVATR